MTKSVCSDTVEQFPGLSDWDFIYELHQLAMQAGWAQIGGRLIRNEKGEAISRTTWIPHAPWFYAIEGVRPKHYKEAISRVVNKIPLTKAHRIALAVLIETHYESKEISHD